jgi:hypothetical protein
VYTARIPRDGLLITVLSDNYGDTPESGTGEVRGIDLPRSGARNGETTSSGEERKKEKRS